MRTSTFSCAGARSIGVHNMELILLGKQFEPTGFVDDFTSLIWNRSYCEPGSFELHAPLRWFAAFQEAHYLTWRDGCETGIVEQLGYTLDSSGERAYLKGRFLEALLDNRVISQQESFSGTPDRVILELVRRYSGLDLSFEPAVGLGELIQLQTTGDNLMTKVYDIAKAAQLSIRLRLDYERGGLTFGVWQGLDRTQGQSEHSWAVFSDAFENINTASYELNRRDWRNFAYVAGEGEGAARKLVTVDQTGGQPRRELWVDARDLQRGELSEQQYADALRQRGAEKLAEYLPVQKADAAVRAGANLAYKTDFDLGDRCTYLDRRSQIVVEQRITGITEVHENNQKSVSLLFGEDNKTVRQLLKREVNAWH